jgi:hypothetical protein
MTNTPANIGGSMQQSPHPGFGMQVPSLNYGIPFEEMGMKPAPPLGGLSDAIYEGPITMIPGIAAEPPFKQDQKYGVSTCF